MPADEILKQKKLNYLAVTPKIGHLHWPEMGQRYREKTHASSQVDSLCAEHVAFGSCQSSDTMMHGSEKKCAYCGQPFTVRTKHRRLYCDSVCAHAVAAQKYRARNRHKYNAYARAYYSKTKKADRAGVET
jgi:hypothetical protein